ncbi:cytochrome P450 [Wilcoxina mikolae CBS 423.85]|nr:cytochrome P450 [Wilcoxina mikolae CBS 423.85]
MLLHTTIIQCLLQCFLFFFLLSTLILILKSSYRLFFHPLSSIPGPPLAATTNLYQVFQYFYRGRWGEGEHQMRLHKKYGPVVRYGPNYVIVDLPHALPQIYHRKADKADWYRRGFGPVTAFSAKKHADHVVAKKRLAYGYSMTTMKAFEDEVDGRIQEWVAALDKRYCETGEPLRFQEGITYLAYDVVTEIAFGEPLGFVNEWRDVRGLIKNFEDSIPTFQAFGRLPLLTKFSNTFGFLRPKPSDKHGFGLLMAEADRIFEQNQHLHEKKLEKFEKTSLLSRFMRTTAEGGEPMTSDQVKFESITAMVAGSRTVPEVISPFVLHILKNPNCYSRLIVELSEAENSDLLGEVAGVVTYETAIEKLPYFKACLREGFRISSVPFQMPRISPPEGILLEYEGKSTFIPPGVAVSCSARPIARHKDLYGEDANVFRPERWLEADAETIKSWEKYNLSWGYGTRICLGKNIAMMELGKICVQFFRMFEPELLEYRDGDRGDEYEDFMVRLRRRMEV